jgi:hypothetical protein
VDGSSEFLKILLNLNMKEEHLKALSKRTGMVPMIFQMRDYLKRGLDRMLEKAVISHKKIMMTSRMQNLRIS